MTMRRFVTRAKDERRQRTGEATVEVLARRLCAKIFSGGKTDGRFSMVVDDRGGPLELPFHQAVAVLIFATKSGWVRTNHSVVVLTATGLHIGKEFLAQSQS